jgi:hypothetical protein
MQWSQIIIMTAYNIFINHLKSSKHKKLGSPKPFPTDQLSPILYSTLEQKQISYHHKKALTSELGFRTKDIIDEPTPKLLNHAGLLTCSQMCTREALYQLAEIHIQAIVADNLT